MRRAGIAACAALALGACRDRGAAADAEAPADSARPAGGRLEVRLDAPAELGWNETDTLRVLVVNATATPLRDAVLHLFVQAPAQVLADSSAARPGRETVASGEGTQVAVPMGDSVSAGRTFGLLQPIRTPPAPPALPAPPAGRPKGRASARPDSLPRAYLVRAWLTTRGGSPIGSPVQDTVRIRAGSEVAVGGCGNVENLSVTRHGIGPVRIGMTRDALRAACPEARDTTWQGDEGMRERGVVAAPGGFPVVAQFEGEALSRILVDTAALQTAAGVGVGSTLGDLRARYGRTCGGQAEGRVAVWFPNAPGISFGLDPAHVEGPAIAAIEALPDSARVTRLWVRQGTDDCPGPGGGGGR